MSTCDSTAVPSLFMVHGDDIERQVAPDRPLGALGIQTLQRIAAVYNYYYCHIQFVDVE